MIHTIAAGTTLRKHWTKSRTDLFKCTIACALVWNTSYGPMGWKEWHHRKITALTSHAQLLLGATWGVWSTTPQQWQRSIFVLRWCISIPWHSHRRRKAACGSRERNTALEPSAADLVLKTRQFPKSGWKTHYWNGSTEPVPAPISLNIHVSSIIDSLLQ